MTDDLSQVQQKNLEIQIDGLCALLAMADVIGFDQVLAFVDEADLTTLYDEQIKEDPR